jgi:hypothetical protein
LIICVTLIAIVGATGPAAAGQTPAGRAPADAPRPAAVPPSASELYDVSCVSAKDWVAVGVNDNAEDDQGGRALIQSWNGKAWKTVAAPIPKGGLSSRPTSFAGLWNGRAWTSGTIRWPSSTSNNYLVGVSCTAATSCLSWNLGTTP